VAHDAGADLDQPRRRLVSDQDAASSGSSAAWRNMPRL
jgi:hypothetical protein